MNRLLKEKNCQALAMIKEIYRRDDVKELLMTKNKKVAGCSNIQTAHKYSFISNSTQFVIILKAMLIKVSEWLRLLGASI